MREEEIVTGIILYATPVGEYDKRLVALTKERGKITIFANGARRANSQLRVVAQSFVMGEFTVIQGRDAYNLVKAEVKEYFREIQNDMEKMCYASYFCELMSYFTREGDSCKDNLNLLYVTLKALIDGRISGVLIRYIYELKLMDIEGQGIHAFNCVKCGDKEDIAYFNAKSGGLLCRKCAAKQENVKKVSDTFIYTVQYVLASPISELYTFSLKEKSEKEYCSIIEEFRREYVDRHFNSLDILESMI